MPDRPESTPSPVLRLDLAHAHDEATRRALYDRVKAEHFTPTEDDLREAIATESWIDTRTAEEAELAISYIWGRWFVTWLMADPEPSAGWAGKIEVLRATTREDGSLCLSEC